MTKYRDIPYTGDDLIALGRAVNKITKRLRVFEGYSGSDVENLIRDLEVTVTMPPDFDDSGAVVGEIRFFDGWLGFYPKAFEARDNAEE